MLKTVLKFVFPVTITGVGGASALGVTSNNQNQPVSSATITDNSIGEQETEVSSLISHSSTESHNLESLSFPEAQPQPGAEETSFQPSELEKLGTIEEQRGNCSVIGRREEIIEKLPSKYKYVSFYCQNNGGEEPVLTSWYGFFPDNLFKGGSQSFPVEKKFSIGVSEGLINEDEVDPEEAIYETTFTSQEFSTSSSIVGKWSSATVEEYAGEETIYKVRLDDKPNSVDYVYLINLTE